MNRENITKLAQEAGWDMPTKWVDDGFAQRLERFTALVAAAERSACVDIVNDNTDIDGLCCTDDLLAAIKQRKEK